MDFSDTQEDEAFHTDVRTWLAAMVKAQLSEVYSRTPTGRCKCTVALASPGSMICIFGSSAPSGTRSLLATQSTTTSVL